MIRSKKQTGDFYLSCRLHADIAFRHGSDIDLIWPLLHNLLSLSEGGSPAETRAGMVPRVRLLIASMMWPVLQLKA